MSPNQKIKKNPGLSKKHMGKRRRYVLFGLSYYIGIFLFITKNPGLQNSEHPKLKLQDH